MQDIARVQGVNMEVMGLSKLAPPGRIVRKVQDREKKVQKIINPSGGSLE